MTATAGEHGRHAERPTQVPAKGLKDVAFRLKDRFGRHRITLVAGGLTYFFLLAVFPAIAALVAIYGLVADPQTIQSQVGQLSGVVPSSAMSILESQLQRLTSQSGQSLGVAFVLSLVISLWSAKKGVGALFDAMGIAYEEEDNRGMIRKTLVTLGFTLASILLVVVAIAAAVLVPTLLNFVPLAPAVQWLVTIATFAVLAAIAVFWVGAVFRIGPDRRPARVVWLSPGAIFTLVGWLVASALFSWYASTLASYSATYGSFASVIVFLIWLWIMNIVLLLGGELNAQLELQTEKDSTKGEERPMGAREAVAADTVGQAH